MSICKTGCGINLRKLAKPLVLGISVLLFLSSLSFIPSTPVQAATITPFGNTVIGTYLDQNDANAQSVSYFICTSSGSITDIMAYIAGASTGNARTALYAVSGGSAGALIEQSKPVSIGKTFSWVDFQLQTPYIVTSGTIYGIAIMGDVPLNVMVVRGTGQRAAGPGYGSFVNGFTTQFGTIWGIDNTGAMSIYAIGVVTTQPDIGFTVVSGGTRYTTPHITLSGGGGTGATGVARVSQGVIFQVLLMNAGSGYTSAPTVTISDPNPAASGAVVKGTFHGQPNQTPTPGPFSTPSPSPTVVLTPTKTPTSTPSTTPSPSPSSSPQELIKVYSDAACTVEVSSISWGALSPGATTNLVLYVRNIGAAPVSLSVGIGGFSPSSLSSFLTLGWDYSGQVLNSGGSLKVTLALTVLPVAPAVANFGFSTTITAKG